ncbi:MAG: hypothetical protein IPH57_14750 [Saprospiraceae bacterium]|nr:hypothetical protein [Saprospiraceae bacterium]
MENKEKYISFCSRRMDIPLFHQPWWLDIVTSGNWDIAISNDKNGNITAIMPFSRLKKYMNLLSLQPLLTPYLGIIYFYPTDISKRTSIYSFENEHAYNIITDLPGHFLFQHHNFRIDFTNWYPFYNKNYVQTTRYTYLLKNIKNHDSLWAGFTNTLKRQIRATENECTISESENILDVFILMKNSLLKKSVKWALTDDTLTRIDQVLSANHQRKILVAMDRNGKIISGIYICWDAGTAYLLGLGMKKEAGETNSVKQLIWESIKTASEHVDVFDFEGSMIPGVERLYRSFGGERTPYYEIKKYKNKMVRLMLNFINK